MRRSLVKSDILFEVTDILGRRIRTTRSYWKKIKQVKHRELHHGIGDGFLVTAYQTGNYKRKGELVWQKQEET